MTAKFTTPVALLVVVMSVVAGCRTRSPEPAAPGTTVVASATESAEDLPGSTPVGTRLRFGEQAVITVGVGDKRARVGVIVTGVERGTPEDSAALAMVADRSATDPVYFIRAVLINEDGMKGGGSYSGPVLYGDLAGAAANDQPEHRRRPTGQRPMVSTVIVRCSWVRRCKRTVAVPTRHPRHDADTDVRAVGAKVDDARGISHPPLAEPPPEYEALG